MQVDSPTPDARREPLAQLLSAYTPCDAQEADHLARMQRLLDRVDHPLSRTHFDPGHFTASAFILSPRADQLLLIFHGKLGRWLQPGGHVEATDADVRAAALREVAEEVGLTDAGFEQGGPFDLDVHEIPALKGDPPHLHFDVRFVLRAPSLDFRVGSDAKSGRWMDLTAIDEHLSDRSVMRAVEKLRQS